MIIYKATNKINQKTYIGQTTRSIKERIQEHIQRESTIGLAIQKYGIINFSIAKLDEAKDKEDLNKKEIYWINYYNCKAPNGYNLTGGGEGTIDYKHSEETKRIMSIKRKGRLNPQWGKRGALSTMGGKVFTKEHCQKIRQSKVGANNPMYGISLNRDDLKKPVKNVNTGEIFDSIKSAAKHYNLFPESISRVCNHVQKTSGGFKWEWGNKKETDKYD